MSIQTEISRIETAKADLKTAIEAKGGTIADGAGIDTYAAALNAAKIAIEDVAGLAAVLAEKAPKTVTVEAELPMLGWTDANDQSVILTDFPAERTEHVLSTVELSYDSTLRKQEQEGWNLVTRLSLNPLNDGSGVELYATCDGGKPEVDLTVRLEVLG